MAMGEHVVECTTCNQWYHAACVNIPSSLHESSASWSPNTSKYFRGSEVNGLGKPFWGDPFFHNSTACKILLDLRRQTRPVIYTFTQKRLELQLAPQIIILCMQSLPCTHGGLLNPGTGIGRGRNKATVLDFCTVQSRYYRNAKKCSCTFESLDCTSRRSVACAASLLVPT